MVWASGKRLVASPSRANSSVQQLGDRDILTSGQSGPKASSTFPVPTEQIKVLSEKFHLERNLAKVLICSF